MRNVTHPEASGYTDAEPFSGKCATDTVPDENSRRNHLLAAMRCASAHMQAAKLDIDYIGVALKGSFITTDSALDWLAEIGALPLIDVVLGGAHE